MSKVLIVDDDITMVKLLQTLLELDGYDVAIARTGEEAITTTQQVQPDIILMDYHLTDTHGVVVMQQIREAGFPDIPVIIASGLDVEEEVTAAGANAFLVKPFEPDDLPKLFEKLIG